MTKKKRLGWDGRSRIPTKKYKENYDRIFKSEKGSVLNTESEKHVEDQKEYLKELEKKNG